MEPRFTPHGFEVDYVEFQKRLGAKGYKKVLRTLTAKEKPQPGMPTAALARLRIQNCYTINFEEGRITFPRYMGVRMAKHNVLTRAEWESAVEPPGVFGGQAYQTRELDSDKCTMVIDLYPYQESYVDYVTENRLTPEFRRAGAAQAYLQADTGMGKTLIALAVIARLKVPALFVVPTIALQKKTVQDAKDALPDLVTVPYSNVEDKKRKKKGLPGIGPGNADIVVCVVNTAAGKAVGFFREYGVVILDEAHELHAPKRSQLLWNAQAPYVVGLSATPSERPDGMDKVVISHLGPPIVLREVVPPEQIGDVKFSGRVREVWYKGHPDHAKTVVSDLTGSASAIMTVGSIVSDPHRMEMVAAEVQRLLHLHETLPPSELAYWGLGPDADGKMRRHSVFVFAEHRAYLPALQAALLKRIPAGELYLIDPGGEDAPEAVVGKKGGVVLRGGATTLDLSAANKARVVLTTYGFSRRGISLNQMTALVEASPRRNGFTQILGRICRLAPDKSVQSIRRIVVDIRDMDTGLRNQSSSRRKAYKAKDWAVYKVNSAHTDYPVTDADGADVCGKAAPPTTELECPVGRRAAGAAEEGSDEPVNVPSALDTLAQLLLDGGAAGTTPEE